MDPAVLSSLDVPTLRALLPKFLASQVDGAEPERVASIVGAWQDADYADLLKGLQQLGQEHRVYPAIGHCRDLARAWLPDILHTEVQGLEHLRGAMETGRTIILTNHMSYADAMATDTALSSTGNAGLADRIVYLAGPKVYQELFRLLAAASIHSLPVPQSNQLSHTENLSVRELARRAMSSLEAGQHALDEGYALLFYPEGSRTRTGRLSSFLKATRRYVQAADHVVPAAIVGTDRIMSLDDNRMTPGPVSFTFGPPIAVDGPGSAADVLIEAHGAIAGLLPEPLRPLPGTPPLV